MPSNDVVLRRSKSVFLLVTGLECGGAERQVVDLAKELKERGWTVTVVSMLREGALSSELHAQSIKVHSLNMHPGVPDPFALFTLQKLVREERPQVVHSHMFHANLLARIAHLLRILPVCISTVHSISEGGKLREVAYRLTDRMAFKTSFVSRSAEQRHIEIRAVSSQRSVHLPNGIDCRKFRPNSEVRSRMRSELALGKKFAFLAVSRIEPVKDYPTMLRGFAEALSSEPDAVLMVVGDGTLRESTEALAAELGLSKNVRFLGMRTDVPEILCAADTLLLSSKWEGLPLTLLEAAATELPIVATDVGGTGEIVENGKTGFLVPAENDQAFGAAMRKMVELPKEMRARMGFEARRRVMAAFSLSAIVSRWEQLYQSAIDDANEMPTSARSVPNFGNF